MEFDQFTVLLLVRKDLRPTLSEAEDAAVQDAHLAHLAELHARGELLAAGPVLRDGGGRIAGVCLFGGSAERARAFEQDDPAVRAGFFDVETHSWSVPAGTIRFAPTRFPRSMKEASGP